MSRPARGKISMIGDYATARADFPWNNILHGELELIGSNASAGRGRRPCGWRMSCRLGGSFRAACRLPRVPMGLNWWRNSRDLVKVVLEWDASG